MADSQRYTCHYVPTQEDAAIALEIKNILLPRTYYDFAPSLHAEVIDALLEENFIVYPEWVIDNLPDARSGRIDVVCTKDNGWVALELDTRKPRRKSIEKLHKFPGYRIIGLRGVGGDPPPGIHDLLCLNVIMAPPEVTIDRTIINRMRP